MICGRCGSGQVEWKGPLSNLTHTECDDCGAVNQHVTDDPDNEPFEEEEPMTNKDGISVEETRALQGMTADGLIELAQSWPDTKGSGDALSSTYVGELLDGIARAYLALSEREAAKDAEIAAMRKAGHQLLCLVERCEFPATYDRLMALCDLEADERAALTKGQIDAG